MDPSSLPLAFPMRKATYGSNRRCAVATSSCYERERESNAMQCTLARDERNDGRRNEIESKSREEEDEEGEGFRCCLFLSTSPV